MHKEGNKIPIPEQKLILDCSTKHLVKNMDPQPAKQKKKSYNMKRKISIKTETRTRTPPSNNNINYLRIINYTNM
jgi:hypothetical protein